MSKEALRLNEAQSIHSSFERFRFERKIVRQLKRFEEEAGELLEFLKEENLEERVKDINFSKEIGFEAIDCIMASLGVIDTLGLDAERLFLEKMEVAYRKYP